MRGLARLVDVSPTVMDLVGLPVPAGLDGESLLPMITREARQRAAAPPSDTPDALAGPVSYAETYYPRFHYNWSELVAVETGRWKFVRAPRSELYDMQQDPRAAARRVCGVSACGRDAGSAPRVDEPAQHR